MENLQEFWHFITHLNETLPAFIDQYGLWIYALLFAIIFIETGLVVMPFLPGDSLLFVAGSLAAVLGDNVNYWVGRYFGAHVVKWHIAGKPLVRPKHLERTHGYFERFGVKTIIIARFVPIVRTITPFVAGIGRMSYRNKFLPFDVFGGALWIGLLLSAGYLFGRHPFVQKHYETVILAIVALSVLPMVVELARQRLKRPAA